MPLSYERDAAWTHAGGVAYREGPHGFEVLLVRARRAPHEWVLPKGQIEPGESPHDCARREIQEEAGVDAEPVAFVGQDAFTTPQGKSVRAAFFLMRYRAEIEAHEDRERQWCSIADALRLVRFDGARRILQSAEALLDMRR